MSKIGVVFPSRGLCFSRTAEELIRETKRHNCKIFFSHGKPIPDCFNDPLEEALDDKDITHIWFVEDDMVLPEGILTDMLNKDKAVVTADYPITKDGRGSVYRDADGKVIFCGTGCLLVQREVFDEIKRPRFHTRTKWNIKNYGKFIKFSAARNKNGDGYGLHDINFCMELYQMAVPIHVIDTKLGQRKLIELGKAGTNDGAHNIETWTKIVKDKRLKEIQKYPVEKSGDLVTVNTNDGVFNCTKEHADKIVKSGKGKIMPVRATVVVWGEEDAATDSTNNV